jgi:outer membrane protein assembly factor BamA
LLGHSVCGYAQKDSTAKTLRRLLILPVIARSIETSWSFGAAASLTFHLKAHDYPTRTSNLQALALYSLRQQVVIALNGSVYFPGERFILNQQFSYSYFPDKFWGLGKVQPDSSKESYTFRQFYIYLHPQRKLGNHLFLGSLYQFQRVLDLRYQAGGIFDKQNVTGRYGYHISGLGMSLTYDDRNNAFSPDRGGMMQFYFAHFNPILGSDYNYTNFVLDLRKFIRLYKQQVLALQALGYFNAGAVPLRSLAALGGASSMRGYYEGRYRDKDMAVFQAEYRVPLFWRLGAVAFGDFGNVGSELAQLDFRDLKYSYGGGMRVALDKKERLNIRLDYGISRVAKGFYFQLGEAF